MPKTKTVALSGLFILGANIPDLPFPGWGHDRYEISHSLIVTAVLAMVVFLSGVFLKKHKAPSSMIILGGFILAWFSHIILDTTYNHGHGLRVWWPLSETRLAMPLPWFENLRSPVNYFTAHSIKVMSIELLAYGLILISAVTGRILFMNRLAKIGS